MKKQYINAVVELLLQGKDADTVLANLKQVLTKRGHLRIHAHVLQGAATKLQQRQKNLSSTVVVAKAEDAQKQRAAIAEALQSLGGSIDDATIATDETLIGGFIATHTDKSINRSYKEKLVSLYRKITV